MSKEAWRRRVHELRAAASPGGRERLGATSIEGLRLFERALRAEVQLGGVVAAEDFLRDPTERARALLAALADRGVDVAQAPGAAVDELCEGRGLGRILGLVTIPEAPPLAEWTRSLGVRGRVLAIADVEEPGNVGALLRTALASGCAGCACVGISDPWHPKAVRTSMGAVFKLPVVRCPDGLVLARALSACGATSIGAVVQGGTPLPQLPAPETAAALFVGSESFGLAPELVAALDQRVSLPMDTAVDSYSVNAAAAILLHALRPDAASR